MTPLPWPQSPFINSSPNSRMPEPASMMNRSLSARTSMQGVFPLAVPATSGDRLSRYLSTTLRRFEAASSNPEAGDWPVGSPAG